VGARIENFKFMDALMELMSIAHFGNEYFQQKEPWKNENDTTLYLCANLARTLAILSAPFLPFSAEKIWGILNLEGSVHEQECGGEAKPLRHMSESQRLSATWDSAAELKIEPGHRINAVEKLYSKIEDDAIENFEKKYMKFKRKMETTASYLEFSDFEKIDLRIGRIKSVEDHPKAGKLYILNVETGEGLKRVVAGIKDSYSKEALIGKNVVMVANLKPKEIAGIRSEGMILAAEDEKGKPILLSTDKDVKPGSGVR